MDTPEKRKFPRLVFNVDVEYKILDRTKLEAVDSQSKDISGGGIRIIMFDMLGLGEILEVKFLLPDSKALIIAIAKIVWIEKFIVADAATGIVYEAGLEFINISEKDREIINRYVLQNIREK